jgi:hypothetical protein
MEERGSSCPKTDAYRPTGKTGVAIGLVLSRSGSPILVKNSNVDESGEVHFKFVVGKNSREKPIPVLDMESAINGVWKEFMNANRDSIELYFTSKVRGISGEFPAAEAERIIRRLPQTSAPARQHSRPAIRHIHVNKESQGRLRLYKGCRIALGKPRGKLKGLHNIFPVNIGIIGQQFFNSLSRADLGNYSAHGNPCSPDTGFTPHDGGVEANTIQMSIAHHRSSLVQKAGQDNALKKLTPSRLYGIRRLAGNKEQYGISLRFFLM